MKLQGDHGHVQLPARSRILFGAGRLQETSDPRFGRKRTPTPIVEYQRVQIPGWGVRRHHTRRRSPHDGRGVNWNGNSDNKTIDLWVSTNFLVRFVDLGSWRIFFSLYDFAGFRSVEFRVEQDAILDAIIVWSAFKFLFAKILWWSSKRINV